MVPYTDDTFQGVTFVADKTGAPGDITWRIETDNNGIPSGTLAHANATSTVAAASVTGTRAYITDYAGSSGDVFTLQANTVYWLVIKAAATLDGSNFYSIYDSLYTDYIRGFAVRTLSAGDYSDNDLGRDCLILRFASATAARRVPRQRNILCITLKPISNLWRPDANKLWRLSLRPPARNWRCGRILSCAGLPNR